MILKIKLQDLQKYKGKKLKILLKNKLGLCITNFWSKKDIKEIIEKLEDHRKEWTFYKENLGYFSFGNVLYGYRGIKNLKEYFNTVSSSDLKIKENFPDLEKKMTDVFRIIEHPKKVKKRKGYAGPAFVMQNSNSTHHVHFDLNEGLQEIKNYFSLSDSLYTCIGMIKKPKKGGRLILWNHIYDPEISYMKQIEMTKSLKKQIFNYTLGSLLIINGLTLHTIEKNEGERITTNLHFMRIPQGDWIYWF